MEWDDMLVRQTVHTRTFVCLFGLGTLLISNGLEAGDPPGPWVDSTPDLMIQSAAKRKTLGSIATIAELSDRAVYGTGSNALGTIANAKDVTQDVRDEAGLVLRMMSPDLGLAAGEPKDHALGVISHLAVLGPFRDTGGGLMKKEGPETGAFTDMKARFPWGTVDVTWRAVPNSYSTARGVPLDLFIAPRKESCTYFASKVTLTAAKSVVVRLASTGSARLMFDGQEIGKSEDVHERMLFDRIAGKVDASAGAHLIYAKVCTGALDDEGRVRFRITSAKDGEALDFKDEADLSGAPETSKNKPAKVTTSLEAGLAKKDVEAIILRTIGGADDMRSPRAPGLLDSFTVSAPTADALAFAAWIAPSGANRSGWLSMALTKARATKDEKTTQFVERRLIAEHLQTHMADWAMASAQRVLAKQTDPEAVLLKAMVESSLGPDVLRTHALHEVDDLVKAQGQNAPTAALSELADLAHGNDAGLEIRTRQTLLRRGDRGSDLVLAAAAKDGALAADAARAAFEGAITDADDGVAVARAIAETGRHDVARQLYQTLANWSPNRAEPWAGLADELAADPTTKKKEEVAKAVLFALGRARDLAPGEARYRAEFNLRAGVGTSTGPAGDDEKYLVASSVILGRRLGVPKTPDVGDRELHWMRAVIMHPDRRVSQLIQYAREIVIAPRSQDDLVEDVPAEGDTTEILRARVHRKDGGTAFPLEERSEGARPRIRWPELQPGDVVEVAVREWSDHPVGGRGDPPFYFMDYAGAPSTHPLMYNEVVVEAPAANAIHVDVLHAAAGSYKREDKNENGKMFVRLVWDKPPVVAEEPLSPQMSEIVPLIVGSTFKNWTDFRTWYAEAVKGFTEPDEQVRRMATDLTKGKTTRDEKLRAIFDFVADDIRYVNFISGEAWLPNRPQELLARRVGDCDDKALLLITLLKAVGIDAQEVMVQTRETNQPSVLQAKNAAVPLFDHGIAYLPGPNGGQYLDATSPQSRLGPLPSMDARAFALRLDGSNSDIVQLPPSSPDDHGSDATWNITLKEDGAGDLAGDEKHFGDGAFWLRTYLTEPGTRAQYVEDSLLGGWFGALEVDKKVDFEGNMKEGQAKVSYKAHADALARIEQGELVVPLSPNQTLASTLAPLVKRTLPVSLPAQMAPSHQNRTMRITAPAGWKWGALPPGGEENGGEFGRAKLEVSVDPKDPRTVVVKRSVVFDLHLIPVEKYGPWRAFIQRIDALMHRSVRALKAGAK